MNRLSLYYATTAVLLCGVIGCGDSAGPNSGSRVKLGFSASQSAAAFSAVAADASANGVAVSGAALSALAATDGLHITRDGDVIVLTKAQLVFRDLKLKRASSACSDDAEFSSGSSVVASANSASAGLSVQETSARDGDGCSTMHIGPYLVSVMLLGIPGPQMTVFIPEGTYSSMRFTMHKVTSNDGDDAAFRQLNPDFRDISARLEGTFNGVPFVFVSDVNAKMNVPLTSPLAIGADGADLTVAVDFGTWFFRPQGGLYSPALANTPGNTRAAVQNNIRVSFRAFRDRNHDGRED